ncbi:hypothetical protein [Streptomyces sp. A1499]|uniref:hypothetical protein n=1 Tax=Streptomyces sp. A1499 TaxID=2563104 RepID=UPI00144A9B22|nr:hypothetical protein [Streptomyces sp. A1499]
MRTDVRGRGALRSGGSLCDGNLSVRVDLGGDEHPPARCEADARKIAAAAIAAMPD